MQPQPSMHAKHAPRLLLLPLLALLGFRASADRGLFANLNATELSKNQGPIPQSFIGFSMEPIAQAHEWATKPSSINLINHLSSYNTGPLIIRWGGAAEDLQTDVYPDATWQAMATLHRETGCVYIITLRLLMQNVSLAVTQVTNALRILPSESVLAFEIGNEPDNYQYWYQSLLHYALNTYIQQDWYADQNEFYLALQPLFQLKFGNTLKIAGPAISSMHLWRVSNIKTFIFGSLSKNFVAVVTAHWYSGRSTDATASMDWIMREDKMDSVYNYSSYFAETTRQAGIPFRLGETNSLSKGGKPGVSDTLGGALFSIDYAMTLIMSGASGMNFHNVPCASYASIVIPFTSMVCEGSFATCDMQCKTGPDPVAGAPYYGLWLVQQVLAGGSQLMPSYQKLTMRVGGDPDAVIKVYAFKASDGERRFVFVKKSGMDNAPISIQVPEGMLEDAHLVLLHSPMNGTLYAQLPDIELAGQKVNDAGEVVGEFSPMAVPRQPSSSPGTSTYHFTLPAASAAILVIPLSAPPASSSPLTSPSPPSTTVSPSPSLPTALYPPPPVLGTGASPPPPPIETKPHPPPPPPCDSPTSYLPTRYPPPMASPPPNSGPPHSQPPAMASPPIASPLVASPPAEVSSTPTASPPPLHLPPSFVTSPATPTHQLFITVRATDSNRISETSVTEALCPEFMVAIVAALNFANIDPAVAFTDSAAANGCSIVTEASSRVFYKAYLTLSPSEVKALTSAGSGFTSIGFMNRAQLLCGSTLSFGEVDMSPSLSIGRKDLGTQATQGVCRQSI